MSLLEVYLVFHIAHMLPKPGVDLSRRFSYIKVVTKCAGDAIYDTRRRASKVRFDKESFISVVNSSGGIDMGTCLAKVVMTWEKVWRVRRAKVGAN